MTRFISALFGLMLMALPAAAQSPVTVRFAFIGPQKIYDLGGVFDSWTKKMEADSGNTLKFEVTLGTRLASFPNVYERLSAGVFDMAWFFQSATPGSFPRTLVAETAFSMQTGAHGSDALWQTYARGLFGHEYDDVKVMALFMFPPVYLHLAKPITSLADLHEAKIAATTSTNAALLSGAGAIPVSLQTTEVYPAAERGVIVGSTQAWSNVSTIKLEEVLKTHVDNIRFGGGPGGVAMNKAFFARLPPQAQAAIERNIGLAPSIAIAKSLDVYAEGEMKKVLAEPGQSSVTLDGADVERFRAVAAKVAADRAKGLPDGEAVLSDLEKGLAASTVR